MTAAGQVHVHSINPDPINRAEGDFYVTPRAATERFLAAEYIPSPCWEPACGNGAISRVLQDYAIECISSDLYDRGYGEIGVDFISAPDRCVASVVTNPPFKLAQAFVERALALNCEKVAMLMRLLWLEGKARRLFFERTRLSRVWVHSSRVNVSRMGDNYGDGGHGGMVAFAWYVWERGHIGPPTLGWLP